jgi:hypothetical protein
MVKTPFTTDIPWARRSRLVLAGGITMDLSPTGLEDAVAQLVADPTHVRLVPRR